MSRQSDARQCLIDAVADRTGERLEPDDLNDKKPSDVGYANGQAWLISLRKAARCLRDKGHEVGTPTRTKADDLHGQILNASLLYLKQLRP